MTLPAAPFGRVLTAMVTPFKPDGSVDLDGVARVAHHLVENGNDGIVVSGTTGEAPTTSVAEDGEILRAVVDAVGERATIIAGVGTNHTEHSIELNEQAQKAGADGVLLVSPYYNKPTQAGIAAHFEAVAAAADLPIMLYDIPGRTGVTIAPETFARVARDEKFAAVKCAVGDLFRGAPQRSSTGFDLRRLSMLLAVLEKRCGFRLGAKDVFINIAGGLKVEDPGIDLALVCAVLSSNEDLPIAQNVCFAAEVGLTGEIRPVNRIDQRISEAQKLGFEKIYISSYNLKGLDLKQFKIEVIAVTKMEEVFAKLFG